VLLIVGRQFQTVEDDVEVPTLQSRDELVPLVLDYSGFDAELRSKGFGEVVLESNQLLGPLWVRKDIRRAAFGISAPEQNTAFFDFLQLSGPKRPGGQSCYQQHEQKDCGATTAPSVTHRRRLQQKPEYYPQLFSKFRTNFCVEKQNCHLQLNE
jgi:hypothetical protein